MHKILGGGGEREKWERFRVMWGNDMAVGQLTGHMCMIMWTLLQDISTLPR